MAGLAVGFSGTQRLIPQFLTKSGQAVSRAAKKHDQWYGVGSTPGGWSYFLLLPVSGSSIGEHFNK